MAVLYMLHIETFLPNERPQDLDGPSEDRREALKRFDRWVQCKCKKRCGREWNFANDVGLARGGNGQCDVLKYLGRGNSMLNLFAQNVEQVLESMRTEWKAARHS